MSYSNNNENLFDNFWERIETSSSPGKDLAKMYWELLLVSPNLNDIIMFNKFVKIYGRKRVFDSIIDITFVDNLDTKNIFGLIRYFIEKKLDKNSSEIVDLAEIVSEIKKQLKVVKKNNLTIKEIDFNE